ncbi:MAG: outer membrane lipoprotein-sorting protein [Chromatiales bacterium]|nr:outer membrane lipoprotein-sorting protein [Chromatiales bacterium]
MLRRLLLSLLPLTCLTGPASADSESRALTLLRNSERLMTADTSRGQYHMEITRPEWNRLLRFDTLADRPNDRFRLDMHEPRKVRGTVFLKIGEQLSMYLPKLKRIIRISPAMMLDAWMGSDFNNQDLLEAGALIDAYEHKITGTEGEGDTTVMVIESTPKDDAAVVWSKLIQRLHPNGRPLSVEFYGSDSKLVRTLNFLDPKKFAERTLPSRWRMVPHDAPGQFTEVFVDALEFNPPLDEALFHPMENQE